MKRLLKVGSLFSGMGAPEEALRQAKIPHVIEFACDINSHAKRTYLHNYNPRKFYDDILNIPQSSLPSLDILVFGFPCQPFSLAGQGKGLADERGQLVFNAIEVLKLTKSRYFIAENVEGLLKMENGAVLRKLLAIFYEMGYKVDCRVLDALDFGLPQARKRVWIVGRKSGSSILKTWRKCKQPPLSNFLNKQVDSRYNATSSFLKKPKVRKRIDNYNKDYINCITQTISRNGSSSEYISYVAAVYNSIGEYRKPTPEECCKLFGFGSKFSFPDDISVTAKYVMAANTMAVPILKRILNSICLADQKKPIQGKKS